MTRTTLILAAALALAACGGDGESDATADAPEAAAPDVVELTPDTGEASRKAVADTEAAAREADAIR